MIETPKYQCYICDAQFDEPTVRRYREDVNGEGAFQNIYVQTCPYCGSEEIEALPPEDDDDLFAPEPDWVRERREWEELHT